MNTSENRESPLVSVVTPVFNGAAHLDECIESVRRQTYSNLDYVIVNNCSTDDTARIAARHVAEDPRIRVVHNSRFMPLIDNWNHALQAIHEQSRYVKVVHADDMLFEECVEKMVDVAERHPRVGLVGAYVRKGSRIIGAKFPFPDEVRSGREVVKETFKKEYYVFGSPSSTLIRADLVRGKDHFYNDENFHADVEACFAILRHHDFGFVHQVLTFTREHEFSQTENVSKPYKTNLLENNLSMLRRYGPEVLSEAELDSLTQGVMRHYYAELARDLGRLKEPKFRDHQRRTLRRLGMKMQTRRLAAAVVSRAAGALLCPQVVLSKLLRRRSAEAP